MMMTIFGRFDSSAATPTLAAKSGNKAKRRGVSPRNECKGERVFKALLLGAVGV
jgi:hypothetical protein